MYWREIYCICEVFRRLCVCVYVCTSICKISNLRRLNGFYRIVQGIISILFSFSSFVHVNAKCQRDFFPCILPEKKAKQKIFWNRKSAATRKRENTTKQLQNTFYTFISNIWSYSAEENKIIITPFNYSFWIHNIYSLYRVRLVPTNYFH